MSVLALSLLLGQSSCKTQCLFFCHDGTVVQAEYVAARDECQSQAESRVNLYTVGGATTSAKEKNSMLLALFAKCMHAKNWGVTAPKKEGGQKPPQSAGNDPRPGTPWNPSPYGIQADQQSPQYTSSGGNTPVYQQPRQNYSQPQSYQQQPQVYQQPQAYQQQPAPQYQAPQYQAPTYQAPKYEAPKYPAPQAAPAQPQATPAPAYAAPQAYQAQPAPQYQAPQYQAPTYQAPKYTAPQYTAPQYNAPQYPAPQYSAPRYAAPAANAAPSAAATAAQAAPQAGGGATAMPSPYYYQQGQAGYGAYPGYGYQAYPAYGAYPYGTYGQQPAAGAVAANPAYATGQAANNQPYVTQPKPTIYQGKEVQRDIPLYHEKDPQDRSKAGVGLGPGY